MGYNSEYILTTHDDYSDVDHEEEISSFAGNPDCFKGECKWYDWKQHLIEYSKNWPLVIFEIKRVGEEGEDIEVQYFKNGKYQPANAVLTWDKFDESKLV